MNEEKEFAPNMQPAPPGPRPNRHARRALASWLRKEQRKHDRRQALRTWRAGQCLASS